MTGTKQLPLIVAAFFSLTSTGWSTLIVSLDPADLMVTSNGMNQVVDVGVLIQWNGDGENTLSGYTIDFLETSLSLAINEGPGGPSVFTWAIPPEITDTSITASNVFTNFAIDMNQPDLLGTLHFTLDAGFTSGSIPIFLSVNNALRDGVLLPDGEVIVSQSQYDLQVAAVPEPASLAMMGLAACGAFGLRRRRRKGEADEQVA